MISFIAELLVAAFTLALGISLTIWPEAVGRRLDQGRGSHMRVLDIRERGVVFRQIGVGLIALVCYLLYLRIRAW